ncbi:hypothetical protein PoB_007142400 [Plakobranchus ocellatus]|uniref:Uncharacterized protein n=1 Tax=Plakobranchus ocellatus TaxID=259542 RepID=A0AAV4DL65_9GAST|nr:hypothetical protein PoB_007142400 [Plakobranchus ocellatus]
MDAVAGYEHPIKRYLLKYHCVTATGQTTTIFGESWFQLRVDSQDLWTSGEYLAFAPTTSGDYVSYHLPKTFFVVDIIMLWRQRKTRTKSQATKRHKRQK